MRDPRLLDGYSNLRRPPLRGRPVRGFGRRDPAYVAPSPTAHLQALTTRTPPKEKWSAEELEAWIRKAPALDQLGAPNSQSWYDNQGRLLALWALEHLAKHEESKAVLDVDRFFQQLDLTHPSWEAIGCSYHQKVWAQAAAFRIFDSYL